MGVDARGGAVAVDDGQEALDEIAQLFRRNGGVFDERDRLRVFLHGHRQAERRLAQAPDSLLLRQIRFRMIRVAQATRPQILLQRCEPRRQVLLPIRVELDAQRGRGIALNEGAANTFERLVLPRVIENGFVHHLDGGRSVPQDHRGGRKRFQQVGEHDHHHRLPA